MAALRKITLIPSQKNSLHLLLRQVWKLFLNIVAKTIGNKIATDLLGCCEACFWISRRKYYHSLLNLSMCNATSK